MKIEVETTLRNVEYLLHDCNIEGRVTEELEEELVEVEVNPFDRDDFTNEMDSRNIRWRDV